MKRVVIWVVFILVLILISGCIKNGTTTDKGVIDKEEDCPGRGARVCYIEGSNACPEGEIYMYHPIHGYSCREICLKTQEITFTPIEVPFDADPFPCYCKNEWGGSYVPRDKPQTFICKVD